MSKIITITGVSGVGKSYLLDQVRYYDNNIKYGVNVYEFGSMFRKHCEDNNLDQKKLSLQQLRDITGIILDRVSMNKHAILISHLMINIDSYLLICPDNELYTKPSSYIVIQDSPNRIIQRRNEYYFKKSRPLETAEQIKFSQDLLTSITKQYSYIYDAGFFIIMNDQYGIKKIRNTINNILFS